MTEVLFDSTRHEPVVADAWCARSARAEIHTILADISASMRADCSWPTHALDAESYPSPGPKWANYAGASGVVLALRILRGYGYRAEDLALRIPEIHASYLKNPDVQVEPGLQIGETGILMPLVLARPDNAWAADRLAACMERTLPLPFYEITSGQTGMMHAALALYRRNGEDRWRNLYLRGARALFENWQQHTDTGQWLWQSTVFGPARHYHGACHGLAGNANVLVQGADLLPEGDAEIVIERAVSTLDLSARKQSNMANWALSTVPDIEKCLVQWCHGAAGIVTAMARTPVDDTANSVRLDDILRQAGELVWRAGPLKKEAGICHGTAGNGYAFLYLHQRWGDPVWLDRARAFAMHAITQCQRDRAGFNQGRYALWTGDAGLAIYLHHCRHPEAAAIPGLDLF